MAIKYDSPDQWIHYEPLAILNELLEAKSAVLSLTSLPFQKAWADRLQEIQLKQEVAGTSRIEGAEFTEQELDAAIAGETPEDLLTRSQKQARAATFTYQWIAALDSERPIDVSLLKEIHRRIVTGCDDDHCEPGVVREDGHNVTFGTPRHRGAEGGKDCESLLSDLCDALNREYQGHDVLVRGLALHYHLGAMHPFADGNGRTARALEALMLQRAGLRDALFISLSNYYYDEKANYLKALADCRSKNHNLTDFLRFGLIGITKQCRRLFETVNREIKKVLFRDTASNLFNKLQSPRKRVIAKRQYAILNRLLEDGPCEYLQFAGRMMHLYEQLSDPRSALIRDLIHLLNLGAIITNRNNKDRLLLNVDLSWPERISESDFLQSVKQMPDAKTYKWLQREWAGGPPRLPGPQQL